MTMDDTRRFRGLVGMGVTWGLALSALATSWLSVRACSVWRVARLLGLVALHGAAPKI